jgi:hypothetical protein
LSDTCACAPLARSSTAAAAITVAYILFIEISCGARLDGKPRQTSIIQLHIGSRLIGWEIVSAIA